MKIRFALLLTILLAAASSQAAKAKAALPSPDYAGVFLDACEFELDSLVIGADTLRIFIRSGPEAHAWKKRSGDTVFYGDRWAFLHVKLMGKPAYLFGEWAMAPPAKWNEATYMEMIPKAKLAKGKSYGPVPLDKGILACQEGAPSRDSLFRKGLGYAIVFADITLREFDISDHNLSDLYRIKGVDKKGIGELEIDWRSLPDLTYQLGEMELEEKLKAKTGRNEVYVKDLEAIGYGNALIFIPLEWKHVEALQLTSEQLEQMGAKAKYTAEQVEEFLR